MRIFNSKNSDAGTVCEACGNTVKVQVVDLVQGVDILHCPTCRTRWQVERTPTETVSA